MMKKIKFFCVFFLLLIGVEAVTAQNLPTPPEPSMPSFQPTQHGRSYTPQSSELSQQSRSYKVPHANDIMRRRQQQAYQRFGLPYIPPNATSEQKKAIMRKYAQDRVQANNPSADNNFNQRTFQQQVRK